MTRISALTVTARTCGHSRGGNGDCGGGDDKNIGSDYEGGDDVLRGMVRLATKVLATHGDVLLTRWVRRQLER